MGFISWKLWDYLMLLHGITDAEISQILRWLCSSISPFSSLVWCMCLYSPCVCGNLLSDSRNSLKITYICSCQVGFLPSEAGQAVGPLPCHQVLGYSDPCKGHFQVGLMNSLYALETDTRTECSSMCAQGVVSAKTHPASAPSAALAAYSVQDPFQGFSTYYLKTYISSGPPLPKWAPKNRAFY